MSTLTKAFVVLVTVLSIVLVAIFATFAAKTDNYRVKLDDANQQLAVAHQTALANQQARTALQTSNDAAIAALTSEKDQFKQQLAQKTSQLAASQAQVAEVQTKLAQQEATVSRLSAAQQQQVALLKGTQTQLGQLRDDKVQLQTQNIELTNRVAELNSLNDAATRQVRHLKEEAAQAQDQTKQLLTRVAQLPETLRNRVLHPERANGAPVPATPILGQVTAVQTAGGTTLVQVNVGKNDGVQPHMQFVVHKGSTYLGTLVVETVDANAAAGHMTLVKGQVKTGDAVDAGTL